MIIFLALATVSVALASWPKGNLSPTPQNTQKIFRENAKENQRKLKKRAKISQNLNDIKWDPLWGTRKGKKIALYEKPQSTPLQNKSCETKQNHTNPSQIQHREREAPKNPKPKQGFNRDLTKSQKKPVPFWPQTNRNGRIHQIQSLPETAEKHAVVREDSSGRESFFIIIIIIINFLLFWI